MRSYIYSVGNFEVGSCTMAFNGWRGFQFRWMKMAKHHIHLINRRSTPCIHYCCMSQLQVGASTIDLAVPEGFGVIYCLASIFILSFTNRWQSAENDENLMVFLCVDTDVVAHAKLKFRLAMKKRYFSFSSFSSSWYRYHINRFDDFKNIDIISWF